MRDLARRAFGNPDPTSVPGGSNSPAVLSAGWRFAQPSFQLLPVYVAVPAGTGAALAWLSQRHTRIAGAFAILVVAQAICWAVIWGPQLARHWLRVSAPAAATLAEVRAQIPESDEVVASQGFLGPFSGRVDVPHDSVGTLQVAREARRVEQRPARPVGRQLRAQPPQFFGLAYQADRRPLVLFRVGRHQFR